jgi:FtsH-binding integral membrane protein
MWQHFSHVLFNIFIPSILFISIAAVILISIARLMSKPSLKGWQLLIFAFSLLGGVIGIFVGMSQTPVIGTVLPALLAFITGFLTYLFSKETLKEWRSIIPVCIISLLITSLFGSFMASQVRLDFELNTREYQRFLLHYEKVRLPVAKEGYLKILNGAELSPADFDPLIQLQEEKANNQTQ